MNIDRQIKQWAQMVNESEEDRFDDGGTLIFGTDKRGDIDCSQNELTSLEGAPQKVGGNFNCSYNQLTSLEGAPQEVGGYFDCSYNQLTSLEGVPQKVGGRRWQAYFDCSYNQLTSLEGAPQEVAEDFYCFNNQLTSLEGAPQKVGGNFWCQDNKLTKEQVIEYRVFLRKPKPEQIVNGHFHSLLGQSEDR